jgi:hypothetical protein
VKIGVYRIYLSAASAQGAFKSRLIGAFDAIPEFLYRLDHADPALLDEHNGDADARRRVLRLAMTPAHVMLCDADELGEADLLADEIALAHEGFRKRIPVLGVSSSPDACRADASARFDRIAGSSGDDLACAIQDLAESAAFRAGPSAIPSKSLPGLAAVMPPFMRPLPIEAITDAYEKLKASQTGKQT